MEVSKVKTEKEIVEETMIEGITERILWRDEGTGLTIASFKGKDIPKHIQNPMYPNTFVAIGTFPQLAEGQNLKMKGQWECDKKKRWSFKVKNYSEVAPNSEEAMIEYLSSGLFKGVGKVTARAIVDMFGLDCLEIIKNNPTQLTKVKGISGKKATEIYKSYQRSEHLEELMLALKPFNISTSKIIK